MLRLSMSEQASDAEPDGQLRFGCPMLRRSTVVMKGRQLVTMRCALGYAIATEEDYHRCRATESPLQCWNNTSGGNGRVA
jgi:hypothetical protein